MANWIPAENSPLESILIPGNSNPPDESRKIGVIKSSSPEDTMKAGENIARLLDRGSILALCGPLGAGKTILVKGIARFFEIKEEITSPTYTIVSEYEGIKDGKTFEFFHIDAYRLKGCDDFLASGGEEYLYGKGIVIIEWADRIAGVLPPGTLTVRMETGEENNRLISIYGDP